MSSTKIRFDSFRSSLIIAAIVVLALPAVAAAAPRLSVFATGIDNPRHLGFAPNGTLYVAAAGRAGRTCVGPRRSPTCFGFTSSILGLSASGAKRTVAGGFLSVGGRDGTFTVGADGAGVGPGGTLWTVVTSGTPRQVRALPRRVQSQTGDLFRVLPRPIADVASIDTFEFTHNSDGVRGDVNSDPYDVLALPGRQIVADAGANALLEVRGRTISLFSVLRGPARAQRVPTSLALGPDGAIYVGELAEAGGRGAARVLRVPPTGGPPTVFASGFTTITGLGFDRAGAMYVTELTTNPRSQTAPGALVKITADGRRTTFTRGLFFPQGVAIAANGDVFVSNFSVLPARTPRRSPFRGAGGQVVRISGM
jgi:hypothetical protein